MSRLRGILGIAVLLAIAWAISSNRRKIPWRIIVWGLGLQVVFAVLILKTTAGKMVFDVIRRGATKLISFSGEGASFMFGVLGKPGTQLNMLDASSEPVSFGFAVAFQVLPVIVFFSSLMAILYHFGIMQKIVAVFAWVMRRTMKISGAESLAVAANIFVGNVASPLAVRPYLADMTTSELAMVMTAGFATVAGSVMAAYIGFGVDAGHLIAASVMSAPAAVVISKLIYPETDTPKTMDGAKVTVDKETVNFIDAAATGAAQGLRIAAMVGAMLIAFLSLIALVNYLLGFAHTSLGEIFGYVFSPIAWCMGVESGDMLAVGELLGTKVTINELVGYLQLVAIKGQIGERSYLIATYALCGFANFGSIAIAIGGIGGIAPSRRKDLARLGLRTMLGGALASWLTASIAGMMI
ncbi:MAG: NupC/NupG family nucleoside CNT transporter [Deltaproteobacteria bacterium]|nr:NupC/NupG family nucleoside CNT transporter [Deltaproteobacteria bacterium]